MTAPEAEKKVNEAARLKREARWAEIERLRSTYGMPPNKIAAELGVSMNAISRQAYKFGNARIGHMFDDHRKG